MGCLGAGSEEACSGHDAGRAYGLGMADPAAGPVSPSAGQEGKNCSAWGGHWLPRGPAPTARVLDGRVTLPPGDRWQCLKTSGLSQLRVPLASGGQIPGMLANILQCEGNPHGRVIRPQMSSVLRLGSLGHKDSSPGCRDRSQACPMCRVGAHSAGSRAAGRSSPPGRQETWMTLRCPKEKELPFLCPPLSPLPREGAWWLFIPSQAPL